MFSGLRSAISEETVVQKKTKRALEHAYLRAFFSAINDSTRDIAEGNKTSVTFIMIAILYTLTLMEHTNPAIIDELFSFGNKDILLTFLVDAMYSPTIGFFLDVPITISSLGRPSDSVRMAQDLDSHILQSYIPRISSIISRIFPLLRDPTCLVLAVDKYSPLHTSL
jgi:hypothetical protein